MRVRVEELFTARPATGLGSRALRFPPLRIPVCLLFLLLFLVPHNTLIADFLASATGMMRTVLSLADSAVSLVILLLLYRLYVHWAEGREAVEVGTDGALGEFGRGFLISLGIVGFMVLTMALAGFYRLGSVASPGILLEAFFHFGIGAFVQVLLFRAVLFRLTEESLGTWTALVVVAAIFGLAHLANENATLWNSVGLLLADVLLAAAFIYTRRLWMAFGIHTGWNFIQDGVFGLPNSGLTELPSWITPVVQGPTWVTGGSFGIEASPVQVLLSVGIGLLILRRAWAEDQFVSPAWRR
ncbi:lysostaphin resistance A-like protein [Gemmatimonadota bacterium]